MKSDIVLIGPPMIGKTTVAKVLASRLHLSHCPLDALHSVCVRQPGVRSNLKRIAVARRVTRSMAIQPRNIRCMMLSSRISTSRRDLPARIKPGFGPLNWVTTIALRTPDCGCQVILSSPFCRT